MISRSRDDKRFHVLVDRALHILQTRGHTPTTEPDSKHVRRKWCDEGFFIFLMKSGKLDVTFEFHHVLRRYKDGRGWIDDEYLDAAMNRLDKCMVLDDLANA